MNIVEKTLDKIAYKLEDSFDWLHKLAKTKLWIASILATLFIVAIAVGALVSIVLIVAALVAGLLGFMFLVLVVFNSMGALYATLGCLIFFVLLFSTIFLIITLCMKRAFKNEED